MKFFKNRFNLTVSGLIVIVFIAVAAFYFQNFANVVAAETHVVQTAKVRKGDSAWYWQRQLKNAEAALTALGAAATTSQKDEA